MATPRSVPQLTDQSAMATPGVVRSFLAKTAAGIPVLTPVFRPWYGQYQYLGRHQIGECFRMSLATINKSGTPSLPDATPTAEIYDSSGSLKETVSLELNSSNYPSFGKLHRITSSYSPGPHMVLYQWAISAADLTNAGTFQVRDNGDADGAVVHMKGL